MYRKIAVGFILVFAFSGDAVSAAKKKKAAVEPVDPTQETISALNLNTFMWEVTINSRWQMCFEGYDTDMAKCEENRKKYEIRKRMFFRENHIEYPGATPTNPPRVSVALYDNGWHCSIWIEPVHYISLEVTNHPFWSQLANIKCVHSDSGVEIFNNAVHAYDSDGEVSPGSTEIKFWAKELKVEISLASCSSDQYCSLFNKYATRLGE